MQANNNVAVNVRVNTEKRTVNIIVEGSPFSYPTVQILKSEQDVQQIASITDALLAFGMM